MLLTFHQNNLGLTRIKLIAKTIACCQEKGGLLHSANRCSTIWNRTSLDCLYPSGQPTNRNVSRQCKVNILGWFRWVWEIVSFFSCSSLHHFSFLHRKSVSLCLLWLNLTISYKSPPFNISHILYEKVGLIAHFSYIGLNCTSVFFCFVPSDQYISSTTVALADLDYCGCFTFLTASFYTPVDGKAFFCLCFVLSFFFLFACFSSP